jgi:hypothetical protein
MVLLRNPLVPIGFLLALVGIGNWYTGLQRAAEHAQLLMAGPPAAPMQQFYEFDKLSARTNASLLEPFRSGADPSSLLHTKLDFYRVVETGGRFLILVGTFSAAAGFIHSWYRRRRDSGPRTV